MCSGGSVEVDKLSGEYVKDNISNIPGGRPTLPPEPLGFHPRCSPRNPFKALRSLIRSRGFFFPGVLSRFSFDKDSRSFAQRLKTSRGSTGEGSGDTHYGVTTVPSCLETVRIKLLSTLVLVALILTTPIRLRYA